MHHYINIHVLINRQRHGQRRTGKPFFTGDCHKDKRKTAGIGCKVTGIPFHVRTENRQVDDLFFYLTGKTVNVRKKTLGHIRQGTTETDNAQKTMKHNVKISELIFQFCIDARPKEITVRKIKKFLNGKGIEDQPLKIK